jgi:hypothetical protein
VALLAAFGTETSRTLTDSGQTRVFYASTAAAVAIVNLVVRRQRSRTRLVPKSGCIQFLPYDYSLLVYIIAVRVLRVLETESKRDSGYK